LAQWEAETTSKKRPVLDVEHFEKVAEASSDFDKYLKETYGGANDSAQALSQSERADSYYDRTFTEDQYTSPVSPRLHQTPQSSRKEQRSGRSVRIANKEKEEERAASLDGNSDAQSDSEDEDSQVEESDNE
jgi:Na+-transporting NADH:ubiquinone oxidoreductase subunit NqrA